MISSPQVKFSTFLENSANLCLIVSSILLCVVLTTHYLRPVQPSRPSPGKGLQVGGKLDVPGIATPTERRSLVLALQSSCRFCTLSTPELRELASKVRRRESIRVMVIFPTGELQAESYSRRILPDIEWHVVDFASHGVVMTPSVYLCDRDGTVRSAWSGRVTAAMVDEILQNVNVE